MEKYLWEVNWCTQIRKYKVTYIFLAKLFPNYDCDSTTLDNEILYREIFDIEIMEGTVNFGLPLVGAGIVANSNGAVCGRQSTGVELGRMEEALKLF